MQVYRHEDVILFRNPMSIVSHAKCNTCRVERNRNLTPTMVVWFNNDYPCYITGTLDKRAASCGSR